ncbi:MAG TPA: DUF4136 domain-containing protein [Cyclobacteriaceae bacterium]|nr:DUF4136 domain-containing protein [Cyclobacteriaceae bacterium]HNP08086.1 DUF4136 domain-containing protein [Cyclobacteriaceae bacterium]HRK54096.1 DUF4136 domain-containing protein [Cyclobacteriaceae bacterium]
MKQLLGILSLAIIFSSCNVKVNSVYDKSQDFTEYKTFCWLNGCEFAFTGPSYLNDSLLREDIKGAIVAELLSKGLTQDDDNPDLLIDFHITMENETSVIYHHTDDNANEFKPFPNREVINYLKGTLIIDMVDKSKSAMVWRSEAIGYMDINPDLSEKNIRRGISLVLKNFPPKEAKE